MNTKCLISLCFVTSLCLSFASCKKSSNSVATSDIKMEVGVLSKPDDNKTEVRIRLIDFSQGEPSYLTLPIWLELGNQDKLIVTSNAREYSYSSVDSANGIYNFEIDTVSPNLLGVELFRSGHVSANTGIVEQFYGISLDAPVNGTIYQASDLIQAEYSLNGMDPPINVADEQIFTSVRLKNCRDSAGNIVIEQDPDRNPASPFGSPQTTSVGLVAYGNDLLDSAVGRAILDSTPTVASCTVRISFHTDSYANKHGSSSLIEAYNDPTLAIQEWSVRNFSNTVEIDILL